VYIRQPVGGLLGRGGQLLDRHRRIHHQQQRLEHRTEFGILQLRCIGDIDAQTETRVKVRRLVEVHRCIRLR
jgi:hypothetical protein